MQEVYQQIISDLQRSVGYLPVSQPYFTQPTKAAAYAMLARTFLSMGDYRDALTSADSALGYDNTLLDYNTVQPAPKLGMPPFNENPEMIVYVAMDLKVISPKNAVIDSLLFQSYDSNDLRKACFFSVPPTENAYGPGFIGTYDGTNASLLFCGLAVDELFLIRAECYARIGNFQLGMNDLNTLLSHRYKNGTYISRTAVSSSDALNQILIERRKELLMRSLRWGDLKRLNSDPNYAVTITRSYQSQTYTLSPQSDLYEWPIPNDELQVSNIPQNPR